MPRIEAIWIKRSQRGPMDPVDAATLVAGRGLAANADQGGRRQVTLIERELWEALREHFDPRVGPVMRRANLLVSGLAIPGSGPRGHGGWGAGFADSRGRILRVGNGAARIRIFGETVPCSLLEDALPGLVEALRPNWGGGAFGEVLDDGDIAVGDSIAWQE